MYNLLSIILYNVLSVVFILLSWIIPLLLICKKSNKKLIGKSHILSMFFCSGAFILQFLEINTRVVNEDFSALMDTMGTLIYVSVISLIITVSLNILAEKN